MALCRHTDKLRAADLMNTRRTSGRRSIQQDEHVGGTHPEYGTGFCLMTT